MQGIPQGIQLLQLMLDDATPQFSHCPRFGKGIGNTRKQDRCAEYKAVNGAALFVFVEAYADASVNEGVVAVMSGHHAGSRRIKPHGKSNQSTGELVHYFDWVWVLRGVAGSHERLVCYRTGPNEFAALHYCPGSQAKDVYNVFLTTLEKWWYHIKGP